MKLITLELQRLALRGHDGELRTRRDDLRTFTNVVDVMDYGSMKRGLLNSFSDLAEELMVIELNEEVVNGLSGWPARDAVGKFTRTVQITPEQLDAIDSHLSSPPQGVVFMGGTFRAFILYMRTVKQKYDAGELDIEDAEQPEANEQDEEEKVRARDRAGREVRARENGEAAKKEIAPSETANAPA